MSAVQCMMMMIMTVLALKYLEVRVWCKSYVQM